ncbi:MBL fold metallo-hydrolase [Paenibacillus barengoltzii]|jgi:predicted metal-dependent RNase|uniref:Predicted metal-dependent RNase, consists of a metallo-beta-lactamase domain and an RNA-binding KH domain n=2 Tax=Paenibacillus TaxID=44249 RepID=A0ABY1M3R3_9BACL|nr:MBL fold metallo-hydrolase [Paenibacillus barengoltzii]MDU0330652.1 MBL fold metallo-hydrolase [Paenibacillus sp. 3LSP]SMF21423.1 Predicted metal-dependent RNase, consists of a metallo-beta-lactamase domain and an RNA-binding KH domain [Paenibacillus barengoltzii]SMF51331.1 Predicted metal-dependent RNase, consists of a metallo-beta-lactamase domain and an RNA-binding KH domain [Paenibacillus barengoltzii J12]
MMKLHIWGGAGEHGRSCYLLVGDHHRILLDCGVKKEDEGQYPLLDPEVIPQLTAVFLSHAHEDHSMALPLLYKHGYKGPIWTTRPTVDQLSSYFANWRSYVNGRGAKLPYTEEHIEALHFRYLEDLAPAMQWADLGMHPASVRVKWGRSGHLAGSIWLRLEVEDHQIYFSGDYSSESLLLAVDSPKENERGAGLGPEDPADLAIVDNAYGNDQESQEDKLFHLTKVAQKTLELGGHLLLPVPAYGRGQDMLIWTCEQFESYNIIVEEKIWAGLQRLLEQPEWLKVGMSERIRQALDNSRHRIILPKNNEERLQALGQKGPCVIFTSDGMMESPRARWYFDQVAGDPKHAVVITGHAARHTFAHNILVGGINKPDCRVHHIRYKVHQGLGDVRRMLAEVPALKTLLVHTSKVKTDEVCRLLLEEGHQHIYSLQPSEELGF